ncbi:hypothetical protein KRX56_06545 [Dermabacteraceae bacterium TAE3-ERU27]|nr:hypothetical protein [Dermabacteraceae bacterium TAE3-ERU27]
MATRTQDVNDPNRGAPSRARQIAIALLGAQALALAGVASYSLVRLFQAGSLHRVLIGEALTYGACAVLLGFAVRSLLQRTRFGITYGITWHLFLALAAFTLLKYQVPGSAGWWFGIVFAVLVACALPALVLLASRYRF